MNEDGSMFRRKEFALIVSYGLVLSVSSGMWFTPDLFLTVVCFLDIIPSLWYCETCGIVTLSCGVAFLS